MSTRTVPRHSTRHRGTARAGVVGLAALASLGLGVPSAGAAPAATIPLDPAEVQLYVHSDQNGGALSVSDPLGSDTLTPVASGYGGSVTFTVPPELTLPNPLPEVELALAPTVEDPPTKTYSTGAALVADRLTVTDVGGGTFRVNSPADNGTDGDIGFLAFTDLAEDPAVVGPGVTHSFPALFVLNLAAGVVTPVSLTSQLVAVSAVPCWTGCPDVATVAPGATFAVTLPSTSKLSAGLGLVDFSTSGFALVPLDSTGLPTGTPTPLTGTVSPDGLTATLTVPAGLAPGRYDLEVALADGTGDLVSVTSVHLTVAAAAAPTTPVHNAGLRSNTGWGEETDQASVVSPLVGLGAGMVLAAGVSAGAVLRSRRRVATEE